MGNVEKMYQTEDRDANRKIILKYISKTKYRRYGLGSSGSGQKSMAISCEKGSKHTGSKKDKEIVWYLSGCCVGEKDYDSWV